MAFAFELSQGWTLAIELGGSAFLAGLLTGAALAVVAATRVIDTKQQG